MEKIASFQIDHNKLEKGMYISRTDFGDTVTYDIRMKRPNKGDYLSGETAHTFEHLFATFARNSSWKEHIVYVGPMGCLTGMYLVCRDMPHSGAIELFKNCCQFISGFSGSIPGASEIECGNYKFQDLNGAKAVAADMLEALADWTEEKLQYPQ